jgi:hypothetical protein
MKNQKTCTKCKKEKLLSEFPIEKRMTDNRSSHCYECKTKQSNRYYSKNRKKIRLAFKKMYQENKEQITFDRRKHKDIKGRGTFNKLYPNHFDFGASKRKPLGESSFLRLFRQYTANAKKRNLEFNLSENDVRKLTKSNCYYCGLEPRQLMESKDCNGGYIYNGIDRKNPLKGYIKSNVVSCCKICNWAKRNLSFREWNNYILRLINYTKGVTNGQC